VQFRVPPWQHQLEAMSRAREVPEYGLFFEMGAGKTATCINILRHKMNQEQRVLRTLILCPPIVIKNWQDEWFRHSNIAHQEVELLVGSQKERIKKLEAGKAHIYVTNYESLLMGDLFESLLKFKPEALVLDESHKCKDPKARRSKAAYLLAKLCRYRYILSGSPILNSELDIFQQFKILDLGSTFGINYFAYRARFFRDLNAGMPKMRYFPKWEAIPERRAELNDLIFRKAMRVEKKDCLDLPPLVRIPLRVGMSEEQRRLYKQMKDDYLTWIESQPQKLDPVVATLAITKCLRLMQITSGFVKTAEGQEIKLKETPKLAALRELLEENAGRSKILIWAVWKVNYGQIAELCKSLHLGFVEIHGETPATERFRSIERFNTDPSVRVLIGHPQSAGIGANLTASDLSIFYSRTFRLEDSLQAEARNYRGGSEIHEKITRIDLLAEDTIDELVVERLALKQEISDTVLRDLSLTLREQKN
jgi:SNF2 family DNA or RNA helicase